ncbi:uncharacterized protein LOC130616913 [Hydractinia symbiolongicarpus]|uniref:uncharacterized protein LOC130616913 n=1 Tax=Hydractinia symbiolongicarpus TaxID=13093 RepID=UPI00254CB44D|nr:uncharacterized protein LOC130616913 [Hydractinia symbiolongicarpus]
MEQFFFGMNFVGGLGDLTKGNSNVFKDVLGIKVSPLTLTEFTSLYKIEFSEEGSKKRMQENNTIYYFEIYLQDLFEGKINDLIFENLLAFITGADKVPPLGFPKPITLNFYDFTDNVKRLPFSSTCSLTMSLPRACKDDSEFAELLSRSMFHQDSVWLR